MGLAAQYAQLTTDNATVATDQAKTTADQATAATDKAAFVAALGTGAIFIDGVTADLVVPDGQGGFTVTTYPVAS